MVSSVSEVMLPISSLVLQSDLLRCGESIALPSLLGGVDLDPVASTVPLVCVASSAKLVVLSMVVAVGP